MRKDRKIPRAAVKVTAGLLICLGAVLVVTWYRRPNPEPIIYPASKVPADWATFSDGETGFEVRYPRDWTLSRSPGIYSLTGDGNLVGFYVCRSPLSLEAIKRKYLFWHPRWHDAIVAGLKAHEMSKDEEESWPRERTLVVPRDEGSYVINASDGTKMYTGSFWLTKTNIPPNEAAVGILRTILSTFRFTDLKPTEWSAYRDPAGRFSFEFRNDWSVSGGLRTEPAASVRKGGDAWIAVYCHAKITIEELCALREIPELTPKTQWFAHRLSGWRVRSNGKERYIFERSDGLVEICIYRTGESEETIARFLDSFSLDG